MICAGWLLCFEELEEFMLSKVVFFVLPESNEEFQYLISNTQASPLLTLNSQVFQNMTPSMRIFSKPMISAHLCDFTNFVYVLSFLGT